MAPRGPKPRPTHLKLIEGNPGQRRIKNEPQPRRIIPDPPDELDADAREEWDRMAGSLDRLGLLTEIDRGAFAAYCMAWGRWSRAQRAIERLAKLDPNFDGMLVRSGTGTMIANPLVGIANRAARDVVLYAAEFGMTPSARARLGQDPTKGDQAKSKFGGTLWT